MKEAHRANIWSLLLSVLVLCSIAFQAQAYYHPDEGRWISRDPISEMSFWRMLPRTIKRLVSRGVTGPNEFAYVQNRSMNTHDPLGLADIVAYGGEPCSKAIEHGTLGFLLGEGVNEGDCVGINICYKGTPTPCAFCNNAHPSLAKCAIAHEQHHKSKGDADCTDCDDYKPSYWNNEKLKKGGVKYMKEVEYGAFQAMLDCLKKEKNQVCGAIQEPAKRADCEAMYDDWIDDTEKDRNKHKPDGI